MIFRQAQRHDRTLALTPEHSQANNKTGNTKNKNDDQYFYHALNFI